VCVKTKQKATIQHSAYLINLDFRHIYEYSIKYKSS